MERTKPPVSHRKGADAFDINRDSHRSSRNRVRKSGYRISSVRGARSDQVPDARTGSARWRGVNCCEDGEAVAALAPLPRLCPDFGQAHSRGTSVSSTLDRHICRDFGNSAGTPAVGTFAVGQGRKAGGHGAGEPSCHTCACRRSTPWKRLVTLDMQVWTGTGSLSGVDRHTRGACSPGGGTAKPFSPPPPPPEMCLSRVVPQSGQEMHVATRSAPSYDATLDRHTSACRRGQSQVRTGSLSGVDRHTRGACAAGGGPHQIVSPPRCAQDVPVQIGPADWSPEW
jgi:hypothetical protein